MGSRCNLISQDYFIPEVGGGGEGAGGGAGAGLPLPVALRMFRASSSPQSG